MLRVYAFFNMLLSDRIVMFFVFRCIEKRNRPFLFLNLLNFMKQILFTFQLFRILFIKFFPSLGRDRSFFVTRHLAKSLLTTSQLWPFLSIILSAIIYLQEFYIHLPLTAYHKPFLSLSSRPHTTFCS